MNVERSSHVIGTMKRTMGLKDTEKQRGRRCDEMERVEDDEKSVEAEVKKEIGEEGLKRNEKKM